ncbi:prephenate dehydrogenase [Halarcobacter anaerophilus]|uniref:prephenate dehydrogenase n=1 Tax=Halarcobacter anaerophilus TaxID=877500 RepID=A0A4Q0Y2G0_9BACT|nr:prephenate dehydrogenase [Halarcobacter anaerophilus]QDF29033.1 chorismate mutase / prephenate dehydrogenase [Halarcobacter anaerophilus]RXJ63665.1 prephenate dehydrogenase [Halarcobacter anaerophilus]
MNIGIIGLGLMGGSLAKALKKYYIAEKIYGYARSEKSKTEIEELNLVDELVDIKTIKEKCDLIVLAIPVDNIISMIPQFLDINEKTTIMDLGSTKEFIIENVPSSIRKNFIAAHPMTGTEKSGPKAAIDDLYEGKTVVLCNLEDNDNLHVNRAFKIFQEIGMRIVVMDANEHDVHACYMSHLPHAISFSLANTVMSREDPKSIIALAAGGFKDMSRVAKSSPKMWSDIFKQNRKNLLNAIDQFEIQMKEVRDMVENEKYEDLKKWMRKANSLHEIL